MLKTVQYSINIEQLLTVPAKKVTAQAVNPVGYEIYEYDGLRWIRFADGSIQSVMLLDEPCLPATKLHSRADLFTPVFPATK